MEHPIPEVNLKNTPLLDEHKRLGAKLAPFGGWLMPIQYSGIISEHLWCRSSAALFDICHMGEIKIHGDPEENGMENILTVSLHRMKVGSCHYAFMLDEHGGIIDDVVIYRLKDWDWMLVVNASTAEGDYAHIKKHLFFGTKLENVSNKTAKLDLQGPLSREVLKVILGEDFRKLGYYTFGKFKLLGEEAIISRTGYTGELGFEFYLSNQKVAELWNLLLKDPRVKPGGLGARDTLRLEVGYPLYGQDIDRNFTPIQAGLGSFVDLNKNFIGKTALLDRRAKAQSKKLVCFITESRRSPRHNYKIYSGDKEIGFVTSGSFSPSLSCGIGMGYVDQEYEEEGTKITVKDAAVEIEAIITKKPFYKKGTARS